MPAKLTVERFLEAIRRSGLVAPEKLDAAVEKLKAEGARLDDAEAMAKELTGLKLITGWQTTRLLQGKYRGFILGKYKLLSRLGAGAMGAVYLAEHTLLRRHCAVKVLPTTHVNNASFLERFQLEAQSVAALNHPNIVRAYDVDHATEGKREIHYLAMEYIEGSDVQHLVSEGNKLDVVTAVDIARQAAEGLLHAHDAGLVHRDIKPANLLIDKHGVVKLLDLGLAKSFSDEEGSISIAHNETLLGTADYISPEQALNSHDADHRSDIYSLGCTMFFCFTGHPPFNTGSVAQRLTAHQVKPPPPIEKERPDIPKDVCDIVSKMMAKEPEERFQSAKEVSETLSKWLFEHADEGWKKKHLERVAAGMESSLRVDRAESMLAKGSSKSGLAGLAEPAVGIDLGTTFSVIARLDDDGHPQTITNQDDEVITPSVVFFDDAEIVVGKDALSAAEFEPERVARFAKRDLGESVFHKPICGEHMPPEVIQSLILRKLRDDGRHVVGQFRKAVVTVPAYFNEPRRKATQDAGRLAGLDVLDIINEPTAAAIAYGVQQGFVNIEGQVTKKEVVLVYDLGGGTFDVTLMSIDGSAYTALATAGDVYLGGIDWDQRIVDHLAEQFEKEHGIDVRDDEDALDRLMVVASDVKKGLSTRDSISFHFAHEKKRLRGKLDRSEFEAMTSDLLDRTRMTVNKMLREAKMSWQDITRLLLVGGSTRMPMVAKMLENESGLQVDRSLSPDEAVAHGAAIYAGILLKKGIPTIQGISVRNVNSHDLGILGIEAATKRTRRHIMVPRNTTLPAKKSATFPTTKQGQKSVLVSVVEGGTDSGANATQIGKCVVTDLPPDLPARTPVMVGFQYEQNGRLTVNAVLPSIKRRATLSIQRASGLDEDALNAWYQRIEDGKLLSTSSVSGSGGQSAEVEDLEEMDLEEAEDEINLLEELEELEEFEELEELEADEDDELGLA